MSKSVLYACWHTKTGRYLPRQPSGQKGGSWVEPTAPSEAIPRFFSTVGAAKSFLTQWLKGPVLVKRGAMDFSGDDVDTWENRPELAKEPRIKEEWQVVPVTVIY